MEAPGDTVPTTHVRGLPLPSLLIELLVARRWNHPGDEVLRRIMPWFRFPLDFLHSTQAMARESRSLDSFADDEPSRNLFRIHRAGTLTHPSGLPWLDAENAIVIAVNRILGDDVAIALDYRTDRHDPRVVASDFWTDPHRCAWRTVTATFSELAAALGLHPDRGWERR
jgi:hypothetical protein